jgi:hypothetical protein
MVPIAMLCGTTEGAAAQISYLEKPSHPISRVEAWGGAECSVLASCPSPKSGIYRPTIMTAAAGQGTETGRRSLTSAGPIANDPRLVRHSSALRVIILLEIGEVNSGSSREVASGHHFSTPGTIGARSCECAERANYCRARL